MAPEFDLQSAINKAMSQLGSINSDTSSKASGSSESAYINSVWGLVQDGQEVAQGNDEQKAKAMTNILDGIMNLISFSKNQNAQANKEVKKNSDAINKNEQAADKKAQEIQQSIEKIVGDISSNTSSINDALAAIEKLGDNGDIAKVQEQIQEQLDRIDQAKEDLKDPDKRDNALETISVAASSINGLVANIQNIQSVIEEQNTIVEENVNNISELISDSATKISEGVTELQQYIQKGTALGSESTRLTTQGGIDVPTGKAEVKAGEAINSNAFSAVGSGGKGAKLIMDGTQRDSAGQTRIQGGAKNLQSLTASIGKIGGDLSSLAEYTNSIGKIGEGVASLAERYTNSIQPYIEATGTWDVDAIKEANTELQSQVKAFDGTQNPNNQNGQEFNYDSSKFRKAFGL